MASRKNTSRPREVVEPEADVKALESSRRLSEVALESGAFGSWSLDVSTQKATRSLRHDQIFGYTHMAEDWTYDRFIAFIHTSDRDGVDRAYRTALESGQDWEFECRITRLDGEERWIWAKGKHFRNADGKPVEIIGVISDITDRKRGELVMQQTEKLAAVGRLASTISHEINNPLEAVTNLVYLVGEAMPPGAETEEIRHYLQQADQELRRMKLITAQALRFSKQSHGPEAVTAAELLAAILEIYGSRFTNYAVTLSVRYRSEHPVLCLASEIRQVLTNLITNAVDAMRATGGELKVRSREATDWLTGRRGLTITIADTGQGMSAATQANMWKAFYTTKGAQGTGLGLWISAEIMQRHHGRLTVRSSQNATRHGSIFRMFLPFQDNVVDLPTVTDAPA